MIWLYVLIALLAIILAIICVVSVYFFRFTIVGRHATIEQTLKKSENNPTYSKYYDRIIAGGEWLKNQKHERVEIKSYDNLKLVASIYEPIEKTKNCMLLFHGWSSHPFFDFSCIVEKYCSLGANIIVVEQRGHGESGGKYSCFGVKERYDVVSWSQYVISRYGDDCRIILDGISMGASTVMMAAGLGELPKNIVGIIADCGFTNAYDEFKHVMKLWYKLPPFPLLYTVEIIAKIFARFTFRQISTETELKKSTLPLLILHGEDDDFVPVEFSYRNYEASASKNKRLLVIPGAEHGTSYMTDEEKCNEALSEFVDELFYNK